MLGGEIPSEVVGRSAARLQHATQLWGSQEVWIQDLHGSCAFALASLQEVEPLLPPASALQLALQLSALLDLTADTLLSVHVQYSPGLHAGLGALGSNPSSAYGRSSGHGSLSLTSLISRLTKRSAWGPGGAGVLGSSTSGDPLSTVRALAVSHAARIQGFAMRIRTLDLAAGASGMGMGHHSFMTAPASPGASSLFSGSFLSGASPSLMIQPSLVSGATAKSLLAHQRKAWDPKAYRNAPTLAAHSTMPLRASLAHLAPKGAVIALQPLALPMPPLPASLMTSSSSPALQNGRLNRAKAPAGQQLLVLLGPLPNSKASRRKGSKSGKGRQGSQSHLIQVMLGQQGASYAELTPVASMAAAKHGCEDTTTSQLATLYSGLSMSAQQHQRIIRQQPGAGGAPGAPGGAGTNERASAEGGPASRMPLRTVGESGETPDNDQAEVTPDPRTGSLLDPTDRFARGSYEYLMPGGTAGSLADLRSVLGQTSVTGGGGRGTGVPAPSSTFGPNMLRTLRLTKSARPGAHHSAAPHIVRVSRANTSLRRISDSSFDLRPAKAARITCVVVSPSTQQVWTGHSDGVVVAWSLLDPSVGPVTFKDQYRTIPVTSMCLGNGAYAVHPGPGGTTSGTAGTAGGTGAAGRAGTARSGPIVWVGTSSDIILGLSLQQASAGLEEGASARGAGMTHAAVAAAAAGAVHITPGAALAARQRMDASKALGGAGGGATSTSGTANNSNISHVRFSPNMTQPGGTAGPGATVAASVAGLTARDGSGSDLAIYEWCRRISLGGSMIRRAQPRTLAGSLFSCFKGIGSDKRDDMRGITAILAKESVLIAASGASCSLHLVAADTTPNVLETQSHEALGPCTALCEGPLKQSHTSHGAQPGGTASAGQYTTAYPGNTRVVGGTSAMYTASGTQDLGSGGGAGAVPSPWLLITGHMDGRVAVWEVVPTGGRLSPMAVIGAAGGGLPIRSLAYSPPADALFVGCDGGVLAAVSQFGGTAAVMGRPSEDVAVCPTWAPHALVSRPHNSPITCLTLSGGALVSGSKAGNIKVWDPKVLSAAASLQPVTAPSGIMAAALASQQASALAAAARAAPTPLHIPAHGDDMGKHSQSLRALFGGDRPSNESPVRSTSPDPHAAFGSTSGAGYGTTSAAQATGHSHSHRDISPSRHTGRAAPLPSAATDSLVVQAASAAAAAEAAASVGARSPTAPQMHTNSIFNSSSQVSFSGAATGAGAGAAGGRRGWGALASASGLGGGAGAGGDGTQGVGGGTQSAVLPLMGNPRAMSTSGTPHSTSMLMGAIGAARFITTGAQKTNAPLSTASLRLHAPVLTGGPLDKLRTRSIRLAASGAGVRVPAVAGISSTGNSSSTPLMLGGPPGGEAGGEKGGSSRPGSRRSSATHLSSGGAEAAGLPGAGPERVSPTGVLRKERSLVPGGIAALGPVPESGSSGEVKSSAQVSAAVASATATVPAPGGGGAGHTPSSPLGSTSAGKTSVTVAAAAATAAASVTTTPSQASMGGRATVRTPSTVYRAQVQTLSEGMGDTRRLLERLLIKAHTLELVDQIGQGAEGTVWLARWHHTNVAVKQMHTASSHLKRLASITNEVMAGNETPDMVGIITELKALVEATQHPNVVRLIGVCVDATPSIVLEFYPSGTLFTAVQTAREAMKEDGKTAAVKEFPWNIRLALLKDIAAGMSYMHTLGYIHGDLRSPNVFLGSDDHAKIGDFGFARLLSDKGVYAHSKTTNPRWLAPEVFATGNSSRAGDVYSFGIIMYELLTWRTPFEDLMDGQVCVKLVMAAEAPEGTSPKYQPELPKYDDLPDAVSKVNVKPYVNLMQECWSLDASKRPSFKQIADRLQAMQHWLGILNRVRTNMIKQNVLMSFKSASVRTHKGSSLAEAALRAAEAVAAEAKAKEERAAIRRASAVAEDPAGEGAAAAALVEEEEEDDGSSSSPAASRRPIHRAFRGVLGGGTTSTASSPRRLRQQSPLSAQSHPSVHADGGGEENENENDDVGSTAEAEALQGGEGPSRSRPVSPHRTGSGGRSAAATGGVSVNERASPRGPRVRKLNGMVVARSSGSSSRLGPRLSASGGTGGSAQQAASAAAATAAATAAAVSAATAAAAASSGPATATATASVVATQQMEGSTAATGAAKGLHVSLEAAGLSAGGDSSAYQGSGSGLEVSFAHRDSAESARKDVKLLWGEEEEEEGEGAPVAQAEKRVRKEEDEEGEESESHGGHTVPAYHQLPSAGTSSHEQALHPHATVHPVCHLPSPLHFAAAGDSLASAGGSSGLAMQDSNASDSHRFQRSALAADSLVLNSGPPSLQVLPTPRLQTHHSAGGYPTSTPPGTPSTLQPPPSAFSAIAPGGGSLGSGGASGIVASNGSVLLEGGRSKGNTFTVASLALDSAGLSALGHTGGSVASLAGSMGSFMHMAAGSTAVGPGSSAVVRPRHSEPLPRPGGGSRGAFGGALISVTAPSGDSEGSNSSRATTNGSVTFAASPHGATAPEVMFDGSPFVMFRPVSVGEAGPQGSSITTAPGGTGERIFVPPPSAPRAVSEAQLAADLPTHLLSPGGYSQGGPPSNDGTRRNSSSGAARAAHGPFTSAAAARLLATRAASRRVPGALGSSAWAPGAVAGAAAAAAPAGSSTREAGSATANGGSVSAAVVAGGAEADSITVSAFAAPSATMASTRAAAAGVPQASSQAGSTSHSSLDLGEVGSSAFAVPTASNASVRAATAARTVVDGAIDMGSSAFAAMTANMAASRASAGSHMGAVVDASDIGASAFASPGASQVASQASIRLRSFEPALSPTTSPPMSPGSPATSPSPSQQQHQPQAHSQQQQGGSASNSQVSTAPATANGNNGSAASTGAPPQQQPTTRQPGPVASAAAAIAAGDYALASVFAAPTAGLAVARARTLRGAATAVSEDMAYLSAFASPSASVNSVHAKTLRGAATDVSNDFSYYSAFASHTASMAVTRAKVPTVSAGASLVSEDYAALSAFAAPTASMTVMRATSKAGAAGKKGGDNIAGSVFAAPSATAVVQRAVSFRSSPTAPPAAPASTQAHGTEDTAGLSAFASSHASFTAIRAKLSSSAGTVASEDSTYNSAFAAPTASMVVARAVSLAGAAGKKGGDNIAASAFAAPSASAIVSAAKSVRVPPTSTTTGAGASVITDDRASAPASIAAARAAAAAASRATASTPALALDTAGLSAFASPAASGTAARAKALQGVGTAASEDVAQLSAFAAPTASMAVTRARAPVTSAGASAVSEDVAALSAFAAPTASMTVARATSKAGGAGKVGADNIAASAFTAPAARVVVERARSFRTAATAPPAPFVDDVTELSAFASPLASAAAVRATSAQGPSSAAVPAGTQGAEDTAHLSAFAAPTASMTVTRARAPVTSAGASAVSEDTAALSAFAAPTASITVARATSGVPPSSGTPAGSTSTTPGSTAGTTSTQASDIDFTGPSMGPPPPDVMNEVVAIRKRSDMGA